MTLDYGSDGGPPTRWATELIAGLTVLFAICYIAIANPLILAKAGVPAGAAFFGTCLVVGIASIVCGLWAKSPTALAPGMAFNFFLVDFINSTHMPWRSALFICTCAGLILFAMSVTGVRRKLIDSLPVDLRTAAIGGIGALLAESAVQTLHIGDTERLDPAKVGPFVIGVAVIVVGQLVFRPQAQVVAASRPRLSVLLELLGHGAFLLSIPITAAIALSLGVRGLPLGDTAKPTVLLFQPDFMQVMHDAWTPAALSLVVFLLYMLIADIAGTPYQIIEETDPERDRKISRAFVVDSLANVFGPMFCTSPIVYYAENNAARVMHARSGWVAVCVGLGFMMILGALAATQHYVNIFEFLPQVAVAPAIFCIGLMIVASSLGVEIERPEQTIKVLDTWAQGGRLPAAVTIVLTPLVGLEYGLAAGLLSYLASLYYGATKLEPDTAGYLTALYILAAVAILARLMVFR